MKKEIVGEVYDPIDDCGLLTIKDANFDDVLYDALMPFEGKKVKITIEEIDD